MRKAVFGEPVKAQDIEYLPADAGPTDFVRLCGALIGRALVERFGHSVVPQITERIVVPDRAIDAEYTSPPLENATEAYGLIGPGRTVFQFKYRDVGAQGRAAAMNSLRSQLRKDFAQGGPVCDRFVLMTNLHLAGAQPHKLRAQLESVPALSCKPIVIWGAAEIAVRFNQSPHLRHLFFSTGGFCTLDVAEEDLKAAYKTVGWPPFVGRVHERAAIEEFVKNSTARVMQVVGPRYVGKTRLMIEALKPYGASVLWSSRAEGLLVDHFRDLDTYDEATILVVDRCDPSATQRILEEAGARQRLKTILICDGSPSGAGSAKLLVAPFEHEETGKLVAELLPKSPWLERSWLRETTGGLPGLILHVAALVDEARISATPPSEEIHRRIGELIEDKYLLPLDADARRALSVASLLPILGMEGEPGKEADAISRALGLDPESFSAHVRELESLGLIKRRGRFVEVIPPLLADRVASLALRNPEGMLADLHFSLDEGAFRRFLHRFRDLPNAREVTERLLSPSGWFPGVNELVSEAKHLEILAPAAPLAALRCLERLLGPLHAADLQDVEGDARRSIIWTLENLALRSVTFLGAAQLLLALAEAENESWSNNATGVFTELFHWQHPEVAAPYSQRLAVLRERAAARSARGRALVAQACGAAFSDLAVGLHHAERGNLPERPYRPGTWEEVRQYAASILDLVVGLLDDEDSDTREAAVNALLASFRPFVTYSLTDKGLAELGRNALTTLETLGRRAPNARRRARVVTELELLADRFSQNPQPSPALTEARERTNEILTSLTEGDLQARLWRWAGPPSQKLQLLLGEESAEIARAVNALALHLIRHPTAFENHLDWLTGDEAERRWELFLSLGREDRGQELLQSLLARHRRPGWPQAFSAYIAGWSVTARPQAEAFLDHLTDSRPDLVTGLVRATSSLAPDSSGVNRILRLLNGGSISRREAIPELGPLRWDDLTADDFEKLIRGLDDSTPETRASLLWPFLRRLARDVNLTAATRDLAWAFLQSTVAVPGPRRGHDWDFLAAQLGKTDPERLLALIESVTVLDRNTWQSLSLEGELPLVWRTLTSRARPGLVRLLLRAEMAPQVPPWVGWELERVLRPAEDADLLLNFAHENGVDAARMIAGVLDAGKEGFWEAARRLLSEWGDDEVVRNRLLAQIGSGTYAGSGVPMVTERLDAARCLLSDSDTRVASWARDVVEFLEDWRRRAERDDREEWIWDYRIRRAELETMVRSADSPQRLWAIGRLLKDAPPDRVRDLLSPEEILSALPRLTDLDETTRRKWTAYARHLLEQ